MLSRQVFRVEERQWTGFDGHHEPRVHDSLGRLGDVDMDFDRFRYSLGSRPGGRKSQREQRQCGAGGHAAGELQDGHLQELQAEIGESTPRTPAGSYHGFLLEGDRQS